VGYEIDFLAVGGESSSGDAIALRYGDLFGSRTDQTVIVIDGGYADDGARLISHLDKYYKTDVVDIVVSTHPDQDHVQGLETVVAGVRVGQLWMHRPWLHSDSLASARRSGFKNASLSETLEKSLTEASALEQLAISRGIQITEPFRGLSTPDGLFRVIGPTADLYEQLLVEIGTGASERAALAKILAKLSEAAQKLVPESLTLETLTNAGHTSPQNESSVVSLLNFDGHLSLFTGDAGMRALDEVAGSLEASGFRPGMFKFVQVPHHGSRHNVGPSILDRLLGPKGQATRVGTAFVSAAAKGAPRHPAKKVTNAFTRRGYGTVVTAGQSKWEHVDAPPRTDYVPVDDLPIFPQVEDWGD